MRCCGPIIERRRGNYCRVLVNCPRRSNGDGGGQLFSVKLRVMADDASNMTTLILKITVT
jgi:hypothetical protein